MRGGGSGGGFRGGRGGGRGGHSGAPPPIYMDAVGRALNEAGVGSGDMRMDRAPSLYPQHVFPSFKRKQPLQPEGGVASLEYMATAAYTFGEASAKLPYNLDASETAELIAIDASSEGAMAPTVKRRAAHAAANRKLAEALKDVTFSHLFPAELAVPPAVFTKLVKLTRAKSGGVRKLASRLEALAGHEGGEEDGEDGEGGARRGGTDLLAELSTLEGAEELLDLIDDAAAGDDDFGLVEDDEDDEDFNDYAEAHGDDDDDDDDGGGGGADYD